MLVPGVFKCVPVQRAWDQGYLILLAHRTQMSSAVENEPKKALAALELFSSCASLTDEHSCYPYFHSFFSGKSVHRFIGLLVSV